MKEFTVRRGQGRVLWVTRASTAVALAAGILWASSAAGQTSSAASSTQFPSNMTLPPCVVVKQAPTQGAPSVVLAGCGGQGFVLGSATDYQVYRNDTLKATVVDLRNGPQRRVYLITFPGADRPLLEDISGDLALSAGRGPISSVADLDIDFSGVAANGTLTVPATAPSGTLASSITPGSISIADHITQEQSHAASLTGGN